MQSKKRNYQKELDDLIDSLKENPPAKKPTLLLHACCGPCSSYCIEYLSNFFDITIFYYNPNIHPETEYKRRLEELKVFLNIFPLALQNKVKLVESNYDIEDYFKATKVREEVELQTEPEKGERCRRCYEMRMKKAYDYAVANNFEWFTTTLSISPYKDSEKIGTIGEALEKLGPTRFLPSNFKKKGGFLRSTQLTTEYNMYRQDYCGCVYSKQNMHKDEGVS